MRIGRVAPAPPAHDRYATAGGAADPNRRRARGRGWAAAAALSLLLTACSSGSGTDERDVEVAPTGGGAGESATGESANGAALPPADPVDVVAGLSPFEPPPAESGMAAPDPSHCPGATAEYFLSVFPDATPYQATSLVPTRSDAQDDESFVQCRLSYELELLGDECTIMEVRDVTFTPEAEGALGSHRGALTTTSLRTYFTGMAQKDGVVLDYTLEAGCDDVSDLSDLESEFQTIWFEHRDQFIATPTFERP